MRLKLLVLILVIISFLFGVTSVSGQQLYYKKDKNTDDYESKKGISDYLQISIGAYLPSLDTRVRYDSLVYGVGTEVGFEDTLLLEDSLTVLRVDGQLRLTRHLGFHFGYYNLSRMAENTIITEQIQFGDELISAQGIVDSTFETEVIKAVLAISFINDGSTEIGISLGGNIIFLNAEVYADVLNSTNDISESIEETVPLPLVGAYMNFTVAPGLLFKGSFQFVAVAIDEIDGSASDFRAVMEYYPLKNLGFGAGINLLSIDVEVNTTDFTGSFNYKYTGLVGYITLTL